MQRLPISHCCALLVMFTNKAVLVLSRGTFLDTFQSPCSRVNGTLEHGALESTLAATACE